VSLMFRIVAICTTKRISGYFKHIRLKLKTSGG
jgi:hypothetical protein